MLCDSCPIDFQLQFKLNTQREKHIENGTGPDELRWPASDLWPTAINYTNYLREDAATAILTIQRCNFTSAWVNLPIEITEGNIVRLSQLTGPELLRRNRGTEVIPAPIKGGRPRQLAMLVGIERTMQDLYAGYSAYDGNESQHAIEGQGPRQFINQTSIVPVGDSAGGMTARNRFRLAFHDPLETFTETLHELSLRYALEKIIITPERMEELDEYFPTEGTWDIDKRERALQAMKITPSERQQVTVLQISMIAVYQTNSLYAFIAVGLSTLVSVLIALLLTGWRRCGRPFSMSPLEIAKAFGAPLLRHVGSNTPASQIAKDDDGSKLRYGEMKQQRRGSTVDSDTGPPGSLDVDCETAPRAEGDSLMEPTGAILTIDLLERVMPPVKGKIYV